MSPATTAKPIEIKFGLRTLVGPRTPTTVLRPFFRDHPGEPVPAENFWTLCCYGRLTEADILTIRLGATPSGLTTAHLHHPPYFLQARCPSCRPTSSIKALKATSAFGLGRRRSSTVLPALSPYLPLQEKLDNNWSSFCRPNQQRQSTVLKH